MGKRILLFILTNLLIIFVISLIMALLGVGSYTDSDGQLRMGALMVFCLVWGMGGAFISLQISRWIAKRAMGVKLIKPGKTKDSDMVGVYEMVERLTRQAGLPMPEVGYYESDEVNAFATGPSKKRSLIAVSTGLMATLNKKEVEGVIGHEIAHIANGDMVTMALLQGVINAFVLFLSRIIGWAVRQASDEGGAILQFIVTILMQIFLSILGAMVVAWFSRRREFVADRGGAQLAGKDAMVSALRRLQSSSELVDTKASPALNSMKIAGGKSWMMLFASHPPLEKRIAVLEGREQA
jgi:heat shock protein HtpX